jgi:hypothetical protein
VQVVASVDLVDVQLVSTTSVGKMILGRLQGSGEKDLDVRLQGTDVSIVVHRIGIYAIVGQDAHESKIVCVSCALGKLHS